MRRVKASCITWIKRDITFGNRLRLWNVDGCDVSRARFFVWELMAGFRSVWLRNEGYWMVLGIVVARRIVFKGIRSFRV